MTTFKFHRNDKNVARIASEVKAQKMFKFGDLYFKLIEVKKDIPYLIFKCERVDWGL